MGIAVLVFSPRESHEFESPVGDHLVGVHVGRSPGAALDDIDRKLVVELSIDDLQTGAFDATQDLRAQLATGLVGPRRREFDHGQGLNELRILADGNTGDMEVLDRTLGLDAVIGIRRHRLLTQQIVLDPNLGHGASS